MEQSNSPPSFPERTSRACRYSNDYCRTAATIFLTEKTISAVCDLSSLNASFAATLTATMGGVEGEKFEIEHPAPVRLKEFPRDRSSFPSPFPAF